MPANIPQGPISEMAAAQIVRSTQDKAFDAAAKAERLGMQNVLTSKSAQASNAKLSAEGSTLDATSKFVAGTVGCLTNLKLAQAGASASAKPLRQQKDEADAAFLARSNADVAKRAGYTAAANSGQVPAVLNNSNDVLSQAVGGQSMVNQAKIGDKVAELDETMAKSQQESGKQAREAAIKGQDSVSDFVKGIYDRAKQTADRIFG